MKNTGLLLAMGLSIPVYSYGDTVTTTASDTFMLNSPSNVEVGYTWTDLLYIPKNGVLAEANAHLSYSLENNVLGGIVSGRLEDPLGVKAGSGTLSFEQLAAEGKYTLSLTGTWVGIPNARSGAVTTVNPAVTLGSPSTTKIAAPVPEPETYAMMIAGLGVLGALLRRRRIRR